MTEQEQCVREEIIKSKVFYSYEELEEMSKKDRVNAIIQVKQDETMKWQRLASQLHYYLMVISIVVGILGALILFSKIN